jgi:hypothetical protein
LPPAGPTGARFDGINVIEVTPPDLSKVVAKIRVLRPTGLDGFDVIVGDRTGANPKPWEAAGATWLLSGFDAFTVTAAGVRAVRQPSSRRRISRRLHPRRSRNHRRRWWLSMARVMGRPVPTAAVPVPAGPVMGTDMGAGTGTTGLRRTTSELITAGAETAWCR